MFLFFSKIFGGRVIQGGALAEAKARFEEGTAKPANRTYDGMSCWALIGEEIIDTEHSPEDYDAIYAELIARGYSVPEIDEMRRFGWRTLGWLNYKKMLWDWVGLDETDIVRALDLQLDAKKISVTKHAQDLEFMNKYLERDNP